MSDAPVRREKKIISRSVKLGETQDELISREAAQEDRSFSEILRRIIDLHYFGHAARLLRSGDRRNGNRDIQGMTFEASAFDHHTDHGDIDE